MNILDYIVLVLALVRSHDTLLLVSASLVDNFIRFSNCVLLFLFTRHVWVLQEGSTLHRVCSSISTFSILPSSYSRDPDQVTHLVRTTAISASRNPREIQRHQQGRYERRRRCMN